VPQPALSRKIANKLVTNAIETLGTPLKGGDAHLFSGKKNLSGPIHSPGWGAILTNCMPGAAPVHHALSLDQWKLFMAEVIRASSSAKADSQRAAGTTSLSARHPAERIFPYGHDFGVVG
jgi:hypothetical protein